jgi:alpha-galactosidase
VSAPLMIGTDVRTMSDDTVAMLTNPEVIAIDQDVTGGQGTLVADHRGLWQVWVKRLASGDVAVALLNRGPTAHDIRTSAAAVGLPASAGYALRDVVAHTTTYSAGTIDAAVPAHGALLFRVSPRTHATPRQNPAITVTPPRAIEFPNGLDVLRAGSDNVVTVTVANRSANSPVRNLRVRLTTPTGWRRVDPAVPHRLAAGESTTLTWHLRPEAPAGRQASIGVVASYSYARNRTGTVSFAEELAIRNLTALRQVGFLSDARWVMAKTTDGDVRANATPGGSELTLHGRTYAEGLFAHSVASIDYWLGGNCYQLSATVGVDASARAEGSVRIEIWADNHRVYQSPVLTRDGPPVTVNVPLRSATGLWIDVSDAGDGSGSDDADLANARLFCG